jgi:hypothetical protein
MHLATNVEVIRTAQSVSVIPRNKIYTDIRNVYVSEALFQKKTPTCCAVL